MEQIADWLTKLGVVQRVQAFAITKSIFRSSPSGRYAPKGPGVSQGHRLKLLPAICNFGEASAVATDPLAPIPTKPTPQDDAERRQLTVLFTDLVETRCIKGQAIRPGWLPRRRRVQRHRLGRRGAGSTRSRRSCAPRQATGESYTTRVGLGKPTTFSHPSTDGLKASASMASRKPRRRSTSSGCEFVFAWRRNLRNCRM
jgi:hypothetical protein